MPTLPHTETVQGIEFAVESGPSEMVGHCWAYDEVSGQVCGLVACGSSQAELRHDCDVMLADLVAHLRVENDGVEPRLVGLGWCDEPPPGRVNVA